MDFNANSHSRETLLEQGSLHPNLPSSLMDPYFLTLGDISHPLPEDWSTWESDAVSHFDPALIDSALNASSAFSTTVQSVAQEGRNSVDHADPGVNAVAQLAPPTVDPAIDGVEAARIRLWRLAEHFRSNATPPSRRKEPTSRSYTEVVESACNHRCCGRYDVAAVDFYDAKEMAPTLVQRLDMVLELVFALHMFGARTYALIEVKDALKAATSLPNPPRSSMAALHICDLSLSMMNTLVVGSKFNEATKSFLELVENPCGVSTIVGSLLYHKMLQVHADFGSPQNSTTEGLQALYGMLRRNVADMVQTQNDWDRLARSKHALLDTCERSGYPAPGPDAIEIPTWIDRYSRLHDPPCDLEYVMPITHPVRMALRLRRQFAKITDDRQIAVLASEPLSNFLDDIEILSTQSWVQFRWLMAQCREEIIEKEGSTAALISEVQGASVSHRPLLDSISALEGVVVERMGDGIMNVLKTKLDLRDSVWMGRLQEVPTRRRHLQALIATSDLHVLVRHVNDDLELTNNLPVTTLQLLGRVLSAESFLHAVAGKLLESMYTHPRRSAFTLARARLAFASAIRDAPWHTMLREEITPLLVFMLILHGLLSISSDGEFVDHEEIRAFRAGIYDVTKSLASGLPDCYGQFTESYMRISDRTLDYSVAGSDVFDLCNRIDEIPSMIDQRDSEGWSETGSTLQLRQTLYWILISSMKSRYLDFDGSAAERLHMKSSFVLGGERALKAAQQLHAFCSKQEGGSQYSALPLFSMLTLLHIGPILEWLWYWDARTFESTLDTLETIWRRVDERRRFSVRLKGSGVTNVLQAAAEYGIDEVLRVTVATAITIASEVDNTKVLWIWVQRLRAKSLAETLMSSLSLELGMIKFEHDLLAQRLLEREAVMEDALSNSSPGSYSLLLNQSRLHFEEMQRHPPLKKFLCIRDGREVTVEDVQLGLADATNQRVFFAEWLLLDDELYLCLLPPSGPPEVEDITLTSAISVSFGIDTGWRTTLRQSELQTLLPLIEPLFHEQYPLVPRGVLLVLSPPRELHGVPLHALSIHGEALIARNPILYSSSATVLTQCLYRSKLRARRPTTPQRTLTCVYDKKEDLHKASVWEGISKFIEDTESELLFGEDATKDAVLESLQATGMWTFFGHCGSLRGEAYLQLSNRQQVQPPDTKTMISAMDILEAKVLASLVILIACSSGVETVSAGDEPLGLVTAALVSGADAVIATQWPVDVITGIRFLRIFTSELPLNGDEMLDVPTAFQRTVSKLRRERPEPVHWAAFVLCGSPYVPIV